MYILFLYAIIVFFCAFSKHADKWYKYCFGALFFITAFRHPSMGGSDNIMYLITFENVPLLGNISSYDGKYNIGYILLNSICKTFLGKYIYFQIVYTSICFFFLYKTIKLLKLSGKEKCLFLFSYLCFDFMWYNWGTLRQNIANHIFYYFATYYYCYRNEMKKYTKVIVLALCLLCPMLFHSSAFINLLIFPILLCLKEENINTRFRMGVVLILSICLRITSGALFGHIVSIASRLEEGYSNYGVDNAGNILMYIFMLLIFALYSLKYNQINWKYKKYILDLFTVMILISSINATIVTRLSVYYNLGIYVAMAFIYRYFIKDIRPIALSFFFVALFYLYMRHILFTDNALLSHYCFMWETPNTNLIDAVFWNNAY